MRTGFDNEKYVQLQSQHIRERIASFGDKLYLEFGGKLYDDYHASRVLPGFAPDSKLNMLMQLKDQAEIVIVISASDIERNKVRGDLDITYDKDVLRLRQLFMERGLYVGSVVITQYVSGMKSADLFRERLKYAGIAVYTHYKIENYPQDVALVISEEGFGKNDYIETTRPLVVITAPGPGSGKMATCLSQLYHENKRGIRAGYAKFETFPVWNLPLSHPVNLAYEAATADLNDVNMIDPFHLDAYGEIAVNYNRDVEIFPVLRSVFEAIYGDCPYKSPTDMGVNMNGFCLSNDEACREASRQEILRRYYQALVKRAEGKDAENEIRKIELLMRNTKLTVNDRSVVPVALKVAEEKGVPAAALELPDGRVVTGKTGELLGACAALLLNTIKELAGIGDEVHLVSPSAIQPIQYLKTEYLGSRNPRLHSDEVLIALSASAAENPLAQQAMEQLSCLKGSMAHASVKLSSADYKTFRKLGIDLTFEPVPEQK